MDEEKIIHSPFQPITQFNTHSSFVELLLEKAKEHAENGKTEWMTCALTGESYGYDSYDELTRNIGSALYKRGLRKGDIVIFMQVDIVKQPLFLGGVWRANGIPRASYPEDDAETLLHRVRESRTGWIYCEGAHAPMCLAIAEKIYWDVEVIVTSREPVDGCTTIYELMEDDGSELPDLDVSLEDPAIIMSTSGTTGMSKGAVLSNRACIWMASQMFKMPVFEDKTNLVFTKGTHISGSMIPFGSLLAGIGCVYLTFITKQRILDAVRKFQPGFIFGFPTFMLMLVHDPDAADLDLSNLELIASGGAPVTPAVVEALMTLPSMRYVLNIYGLTESAPLACSYNFDEMDALPDRPAASIGYLTPGTSAKFVDVESGALCGPGEIGELCVKCDGMFTGYYLNPKASEEAFEDGFFKTGDVGYYDENGYIFLVDRAKEIFKYFNNHISPTEIENIILAHPSIREVCVIGFPDPDGGGHIPRAFCVRMPDVEITTNEVLEYTNEKLATYKNLRGGVYFVQELPKGKTGKVSRQLVEQINVEDLDNPEN